MGPGDGAFVHVFAPARSADEFVAAAIEFMGTLRWAILEIDGVEPFAERMSREKLEADFVEIAESVADSQQPDHDHTFHVYPADAPDDEDDE